jgi:hypothetical protein
LICSHVFVVFVLFLFFISDINLVNGIWRDHSFDGVTNMELSGKISALRSLLQTWAKVRRNKQK